MGRLRLTSARALALVLGAACGEPSTAPRRAAGEDTFVVASRGQRAADVAWVSLPPGAIPAGSEAHLRVARTGSTAVVPLVAGGFDPVRVTAAVDDEVLIEVETADAVLSFSVRVPKPARPVIVRTSPPVNKRDVPLNAVMVVVFSEPIDPATATSATVQLRRAGAPGAAVAGRLTLTDAASLVAQIVPDAPLAAGADYELVVTQGVRDAEGMALADGLVVPFTTAAATAEPSPIVVSRAFDVSVAPPPSDDGLLPPGTVTVVSLRAGTFPGARYATIEDTRSGLSTSRQMTDGGFDPAALRASTGDEIRVTVDRGDGSRTTLLARVPVTSRPVVVRAYPAPGQRDVPPDVVPTVVFSEPVDESFAAGTGSPVVGLRHAGAWVETEMVGGAYGGTGTFVLRLRPLAPLVAAADYELVVQDVLGADRLEPASPVLVAFRVAAPPAGTPDAELTITSFAMLEIESPTRPGTWFYAPQVRVSETGGRSDAIVTRLDITLVGGSTAWPMCTAGALVPRGGSAELISELYGDWELTFGGDERMPAGEVTLVVNWRDAAGRTGAVSARTTIVPGAMPTTYTGGTAHNYYVGTFGTCQR